MSSPHASTSFTQMADTDLEAIGRNCQYEFCGQLDFLPFRCESCRGTYCLEHRTETAHKCTHPGEWARRKREVNSGISTSTTTKPAAAVKATVYNTDQCSHPSCKTLINTPTRLGVHCDKCNRNYCLEHRLGEEHDCAKLIPLGARVGSGATPSETIRSMFSKLRGIGKDVKANAASATPKVKLPSNIQSRMTGGGSAIAQLNEMKRTAKGDTSVPTERRVYLHVVGTVDKPTANNSNEPPSGNFFYDSRWKVGRVLDDAARKLRVENVNNRGGGEEARLRIFHIESGQFLEFSDSIGGEGSKVKSGHTIVLLRGAGVLLDK